MIEEEKAAATVEKYIRDINVFADWLGEKDLDKETVLTYKENLIKNYAPASFSPGVFSLIRNVSESVIVPIAGIILTFIVCNVQKVKIWRKCCDTIDR